MPPQTSSAIHIYPYPDVMATGGLVHAQSGARLIRPLDQIRQYHRLREDGYVKKAENRFREDGYVKKAEPHRDLKPDSAYHARTLVITWDRVPGARWALQIPEGFGVHATKTVFRIDLWTWQNHGDDHCTLVNRTDDPPGELRCDYRVGPNRLDITMTYTLDSDEVREDVMCQACFNHLWADGFGRDAYAMFGGKLKALRDDDPEDEKGWRRFISLEGREDYGQYIRPKHHGAEGQFIATTRRGDDPLTIGFASPNALAIAWSFWPCTDMDFSLGPVGSSAPGTAAATIHFLPGELETNLNRIKVQDEN